jgi:hypothetical protein
LRPSTSMSSLSSNSSTRRVANKEQEKVPFANGITHWPNGSPMTKIEISAVHSKSQSVFHIFLDSLILVLNAQESIMETLNDPEKFKQVNPKQLQRIVAYQTWFNESFEKNALKERTKLEKKQEKDFQKAIKTLEEVNTVYEEKKAMVEELQSARLAREELAILEEMMPKLGTNKL